MKISREKYEEGIALLKRIFCTPRTDGPGRKGVYQPAPPKNEGVAQPVPHSKRRKSFIEWAEEVAAQEQEPKHE